MTAGPAYRTIPPPRARWGAGRVVALVCGILLLVPGLALALGGGALVVLDHAGRTGNYLLSSTGSVSAPGYALTSDRIDLNSSTGWFPVSSALGTARVDVTARDGRAVFVGVAPAAAASGYLSGVGRTVVDDLGNGGNVRGTATLDGGPPAAPPGQQTFWTARASGTGTQQLTWQPTRGDWALVVMNADGSAGVSVQARVGATVPALSGLAWGLLAGGLVLVLAGVLLVVLAARRRAVAPAGYGMPPAPQQTYGLPPVPQRASQQPQPGWEPPQPRSTVDSPDPARTGPPSPPSPPPAG
jgi:hypothetical protein